MRHRRGVLAYGHHLGLAAGAAGVVAAGMLVGLVFSGSSGALAAGIKIDGVDVGGMTPKVAQALLERRSGQLARVPVTFVAGGKRFSITPQELGVTVDWRDALASAQSKGQGVGIIRGYHRLALRLFPQDIAPKARAYDAAVAYEVGRLASKIDRPHKEARLVRHGLTFEEVAGETGLRLDRQAASQVIVDALSGLSRSGPVALPVTRELPTITKAQLTGIRTQARRALSGPVTLEVGSKSFDLTPKQLAPMLQLPQAPGGKLMLGGRAADGYFARLEREVGRPARGASFAAAGDQVKIVPAQPGLALDVPSSAAAVLAASQRVRSRVAHAVVGTVQTGRTDAAARAMGITALVGSFETLYGGVPNRIHNVQLVAHLVDNKLIAPGATFSFNKATGDRTAAKGFLEAPVIMNGEVSTGLGGGVCQVSTTVFNAAYDAGLPITARTNHALYISHYPLGRDATVDYPDVDLKFVNDTGRWLLLRTFVGSSSLVVSLYGTPQHRRVVSNTAPLTVVSPPPVQRKLDKSLKPGERIVEDPGEPALTTSVRREVYSSSGKLLSDATWYSNYRSTPKIVLVGPKKHEVKLPPAITTPVTTPGSHALQQ